MYDQIPDSRFAVDPVPQEQPETPIVDYQWTPVNQRRFLEELAFTGNVTKSAKAVQMSLKSAYSLRHRANGRAFHYGWEAAILLARGRLVDVLLERAIDGQEEHVIRDYESGVYLRSRIENRLSLAVLSRLDNMVTRTNIAQDVAISRLVAQNFEHFLDHIELEGADSAMRFVTQIAAPLMLSENGCGENVGNDYYLSQNTAKFDGPPPS